MNFRLPNDLGLNDQRVVVQVVRGIGGNIYASECHAQAGVQLDLGVFDISVVDCVGK